MSTVALYIDVTAIPETIDCVEAREIIASAEFRKELAACRDAELVDYAGVARLKLPPLEALYRTLIASASSERRVGFDGFRPCAAASSNASGGWVLVGGLVAEIARAGPSRPKAADCPVAAEPGALNPSLDWSVVAARGLKVLSVNG